MIPEAAIIPKNENSGSKTILTNILPRFSLMERKRPGHNFLLPSHTPGVSGILSHCPTGCGINKKPASCLNPEKLHAPFNGIRDQNDNFPTGILSTSIFRNPMHSIFFFVAWFLT
jgi:hypothetical protein